MRNRLSVIIVVVTCFVFGFFVIPLEAQTLPITVRNTSDTVVAGACVAGASTADCSLRGAIQAANSNASFSLITLGIPASDPFCSAGVCTINLTQALPEITAPASIVGPGANLLIVKPVTGGLFRVLAINQSGTVSISGLTISNGFTVGGTNAGGILNYGGGTLNLIGCTISGNRADELGGGISNLSTLNVINSTITGNTASEPFGGGIFSDVSSTLNITNSTISGNTGGGIFSRGTLNLTNSTISGNQTAGILGGGGIYHDTGVGSVKNSIIALNTTTNTGPDVAGNFTSAGFNLIGKRDGSAGFTAPTDLTGTIASPLNPMLDPAGLQNNGGTTKTIRLLSNSPAIDKGTSNGLTGDLTTDQRGAGFSRRVDDLGVANAAGGNGTDIGAFERVESPVDFDGDGKTDISIFRPAPGEWWYLRSLDGGNAAAQFGASTDKITPGDFTGDGKTDIAFFRPSTGFWFVLRSEDFSFYALPFGVSTDIPAPADFDGDGKADPAVFRPSDTNWYIARSSGGTTIQQFGANGDAPVPADYDGDWRADIAIYRPSLGQWWIHRSFSDTTFALQFGAPTDKPVQGDYTGDGKADIAFWRPPTGEWYVLRSENMSFYSVPFGTTGDIPAPGDYDGDGKVDTTVFRPSSATWFVQRSSAGTLIQQFGANGDRPVPNAFVP